VGGRGRTWMGRILVGSLAPTSGHRPTAPQWEKGTLTSRAQPSFTRRLSSPVHASLGMLGPFHHAGRCSPKRFHPTDPTGNDPDCPAQWRSPGAGVPCRTFDSCSYHHRSEGYAVRMDAGRILAADGVPVLPVVRIPCGWLYPKGPRDVETTRELVTGWGLARGTPDSARLQGDTRRVRRFPATPTMGKVSDAHDQAVDAPKHRATTRGWRKRIGATRWWMPHWRVRPRGMALPPPVPTSSIEPRGNRRAINSPEVWPGGRETSLSGDRGFGHLGYVFAAAYCCSWRGFGLRSSGRHDRRRTASGISDAREAGTLGTERNGNAYLSVNHITSETPDTFLWPKSFTRFLFSRPERPATVPTPPSSRVHDATETFRE
jgi:hypothetical protein